MIAGVNLIPRYHRQARRRKAYAFRWVGICVGYALLSTAAGLGVQIIWARDAAPIAHKLTTVRERIDRTNAQIAALKPKLAEMQTTLAASRTVGTQPDWSVLLKVMARLLDQDAVLGSCRLAPASASAGSSVLRVVSQSVDKKSTAPEQYVVQLRGLGRTQEAVAGYVLRLEKTGLFKKVAMIDTHREPFLHSGNAAIGFQIRCTLADGPEHKP